MANREEMLARIRQALGRTRPMDASASEPSPALPVARMEAVMPPIPPSELLPKFEAEIAKVAGVAHRVASMQELTEILAKIIQASQDKSAVISRNPLLARLKLAEILRAQGVSITEWPASDASSEARTAYREACFSAAVGITGVDCALAETGTLVVTSQTEGSQLASLAPPIHVALYTREQLIESLDDVLERLPLGQNPQDPAAGRSVVFITGTSRTADIEQILIRGVHGPKELHVVLIENSALESLNSK